MSPAEIILMIQREVVATIAQKFSVGQVCVVFPFGVPEVTVNDNPEIYALFLTISKKKQFHLRVIHPKTHELFLSLQLKKSNDVSSRGNILFVYFGEYIIRSDPTYPIIRFCETVARLLDKVIRFPPKKFPKKYVVGEEVGGGSDTDIELPINSEVEVLREYDDGVVFVRSLADKGETGFIRLNYLNDEKMKGDLDGFQSIIVDQQNSVLRQMVATQGYIAQRKDEISIKKDDRITVYEETERNWWKGECNGKTGLFPVTYCHEVDIEVEKSIENLSDTVILGDPRRRRMLETSPLKNDTPKKVFTKNNNLKKPKRTPPPKPKNLPISKPKKQPPLPPGPPTNIMSELQERMKRKKPNTAPPSPPKKIDIGPAFEGSGLLEELSNRLKEREHFPSAPLIQLAEQDEQTLDLQEGDRDEESGVSVPLIQLSEQSEERLDLQEATESDMIGKSGVQISEMIEQYQVLMNMQDEGEMNPNFSQSTHRAIVKGGGITSDLNRRESLSMMSMGEKERLVENITTQLGVLGNLKNTLILNFNSMKNELEMGHGKISLSKKKHDRKSLRISNRFRSIVGRYEGMIQKQKKSTQAVIDLERKKRLKELEEIEDEIKYVNEMISVFDEQKNIIRASCSK